MAGRVSGLVGWWDRGSKGSWAWQAAIIGGLLCFSDLARAQTLTILTSPGAMTINSAIVGQPPTSKTSNATSYVVAAKKKQNPLKVTARLNSAMPPGMTLTITMTAPTGATSLGPVTLDATARDVVGNITNTVVETEQITYVVAATAAAGVVTPQSRTVTFTLTAWP